MSTLLKSRKITTLLATGLLCAAFLLPGLAVAAEAGKFQFVIGDIKVISAAGTQRVPVKGEAFNAGDTIVTGSGASAQIRMTDGGLVAVRPDTHMKLDQYVFNGREDGAERKLVSLIKGGFRAITGLIGNRNKDNYKILTPSATIGIRGTDHEAVVIQPGTKGGFQVGTYDRVYRGATIIETDKGKLIVNPNQVGFTPGKGAVPVLLPRIPEFFETRTNRPDAAGDAQGDASKDGEEGGDSKSDAKSSSRRTLPGTRSATTLKSTDKDAATSLRSPLDATTAKDLDTSSTLKSDLLNGDAPLTTPLDTRSTSTLNDATVSTPTSTLKSDVLSTPVTVPTTTLRSTDVLDTPVKSPTTTIKAPVTTTVTTPITTIKTPITTSVTPKTEAITVPTTTIRSPVTIKP